MSIIKHKDVKVSGDYGYATEWNKEHVVTSLVLSPYGSVLHLPFDEGSGSIVRDLSRYGNHGVIYGASWVDGKFGKALSFDGENDYVNALHSASLMVTTNLTLSCWFNTQKLNAYQQLLAKRSGGGGTKGYGLLILFDNKISGVIDDGTGANTTTSTTTVTAGVWYHVAFVRDNGVQRLYVNGVLETTTTYSIGDISNTEPLRIGARGDLLSWFEGIIDEVRIFNRALSTDEILNLYIHGIHSHPLPLHGCIAYLKAGVPSDDDFAETVDGIMVIDTTNHRIYVRDDGVWRYAELTTP